MDGGLTGSRFRTTRWTVVARAPESRADLAALLTEYWSPVYAYLRRRRHSPDDAADLTQSFLTRVIDRDLVRRADATRGRFRTFLLTALDRYVVDEWRRRRGRDGRGASVVGWRSPDALRAAEPRRDDEPEAAYTRQWATVVLGRAVRSVERDCLVCGMERQWRAFEERILRPVRGHAATPMEDLVAGLGETARRRVDSMILTIRRKIAREVREIIHETIDDPDDVERELAELRRALNA